MHPDLQRLTQVLRAAAHSEIMPRFHHVKSSAKADGSLVTETDAAAQASITAALTQIWPGIPLLGEEMTQHEQAQLLGTADQAIWVLDPLDGTSNYAGGYPGFAISLALVEHGQVVQGAVLDPVRNECFCARRGGGAWCNGAPIAPFAPGPRLGDCLAMVDFKRLPAARIPALFRPGGFRSQRNLGASALEWCWLAAGRFQLYLHGGQKLWDYAAGQLIADEAGVASRAYRPYGSAAAAGLDLEPRLQVAAATPALLEQWLAFIDLPFIAP
ncbi:inositol monophosphatase family protein [uncultured Thiodictyon sp.]|uniref:inositol monophosphatase family protein n=1 Tax=uncultured Thiodictyon sp. TaxID=1846217 RepID=UPI0025D3E546|nr:inositol monophosphatase family protein [uncultured Thiodictyon sp.]